MPPSIILLSRVSIPRWEQGMAEEPEGLLIYFLLSVSPQCSASCGVGVQNRDVYCRLKGSGRVRDDACDARRRPAEARPCRRAECALYTWVAGDWEEVSAGVGDEHG